MSRFVSRLFGALLTVVLIIAGLPGVVLAQEPEPDPEPPPLLQHTYGRTGTAVTGRVTSADGRPAPGVKVDLFTARSRWVRDRFVTHTRTDGAGAYAFAVDGSTCHIVVAVGEAGARFGSGRFSQSRSLCPPETATEPPPPDCAGICVELSGDKLIDEDGRDVSMEVPIDVLDGTYQVTLVSADPAHRGPDPQPPQPGERWILEALDADRTVLFATAPSIDLEDGAVAGLSDVGEYAFDDVAFLRARHARPGSSPNSVVPSRVELITRNSCDGICLNLGDEVLLNADGADVLGARSVDLTPGRYEVTLYSEDRGHREGFQPDQLGEQWFLEALDADGDVLFVTDPSADLAEDSARNATSVGVYDFRDVVGVRPRHARSDPSINSVRPVQIKLRPVSEDVASDGVTIARLDEQGEIVDRRGEPIAGLAESVREAIRRVAADLPDLGRSSRFYLTGPGQQGLRRLFDVRTEPDDDDGLEIPPPVGIECDADAGILTDAREIDVTEVWNGIDRASLLGEFGRICRMVSVDADIIDEAPNDGNGVYAKLRIEDLDGDAFVNTRNDNLERLEYLGSVPRDLPTNEDGEIVVFVKASACVDLGFPRGDQCTIEANRRLVFPAVTDFEDDCANRMANRLDNGNRLFELAALLVHTTACDDDDLRTSVHILVADLAQPNVDPGISMDGAGAVLPEYILRPISQHAQLFGGDRVLAVNGGTWVGDRGTGSVPDDVAERPAWTTIVNGTLIFQNVTSPEAMIGFNEDGTGARFFRKEDPEQLPDFGEFGHDVIASTTSIIRDGDCAGADARDNFSAIGIRDERYLVMMSNSAGEQVDGEGLCRVFQALGVQDGIRLDGGPSASAYTGKNGHLNELEGLDDLFFGNSRNVLNAVAARLVN